MRNHIGIAVWLWQFRMGFYNDECLPFETRLHLGIRLGILFSGSFVYKCHYDSSYITKQCFAENGDRLNSKITKLLLELHFRPKLVHFCFQNVPYQIV